MVLEAEKYGGDLWFRIGVCNNVAGCGNVKGSKI